jgi:hypothetical protein
MRITTLLRAIDNPLDCSATALAEGQGVGDLHGSTTTSNTLLLTNAEYRGHRVDNQSEIKNGIERQLRSWGSSKERTAGLDVGRG